MSKLSEATSISRETKEKVYERDKGKCILCGKPGLPEAHFISRSHLGMGVEENIVTLCRECHNRYDHTTEKKKIKEQIRSYLKSKYEDWNEEKLIYKRWNF